MEGKCIFGEPPVACITAYDLIDECSYVPTLNSRGCQQPEIRNGISAEHLDIIFLIIIQDDEDRWRSMLWGMNDYEKGKRQVTSQ